MATDPTRNQIGYAVASKTFYVGIIGFTLPGIGAVLCQGKSNLNNGPTILNHIKQGKSLQQIIEEIKTKDPEIEKQQLGIVDSTGNTYAFTGRDCNEWAGHQSFDGYTCQGNILTGPEVVDSMSMEFESSTGTMAERLMNALIAGDKAGGDRRGKQSASIKVVSPDSGFNGIDTFLNLHIYDHVEPVAELDRITKIALTYISRAREYAKRTKN